MFKKYNSIENSYQQKYIMKVLERYPELKDETYSIREKIDGSNLQLYFEPFKEMKIGKRSSFLRDDENFFNAPNVISNYEAKLSNVQNYVNTTGSTVRLYGEIYGPGIQKRVNYGDQKAYAIYDMEMDGEILSQVSFEIVMSELSLEDLHVPLLGYASSLSEALEWNVNFNSKVLKIENNPAEGIVIKPYDTDITFNGQRFILKKKSDQFAEKMKNKPSKERTKETSKIVTAKIEFQSYINDNRLKSIFSKHGIIEDMNEFGKYIKLTLNDATEDFLKEYDTSDLSEKELKSVLSSGGKHVAILLKEYV